MKPRIFRPATRWLLGLLPLVSVPAAFAQSPPLIVVEDHGGASALPYYQALDLQPRTGSRPSPRIEMPRLTYLALPVSLHPLMVLLPSAAMLGVAMNIAVSSFKKYL